VSRLTALGGFVYELLVGDDPRVAAGVAAALVVTWLLAHHAVTAWWVVPLAVALLLGLSVRRVARPPRR
jgi:hypothetical protein